LIQSATIARMVKDNIAVRGWIDAFVFVVIHPIIIIRNAHTKDGESTTTRWTNRLPRRQKARWFAKEQLAAC